MRPRAPSLVLSVILLGCGPGLAATPSAVSAAPPTVAPADPGPLAVPGPAASSCTDDSTCLHHRCNLAYGKCAFPCASDADCARGTTCFKAVISTCQARPPNEP